jgi:peptidase A4-like protein
VRGGTGRGLRVLAFAAAGGSALALAAQASATDASALFHARPVAVVAANRSQNWFGYNQGEIEKGVAFHSITADWVVPAASQHSAGEAEYSSTWAGIGGGCVDASCGVVDNTLIQAGTEQDVTASGVAVYSAWWEVLPGPSMAISGMAVGAGDHMSVAIGETRQGSELWSLTLKDVTRHESYSRTIPYGSSYASAEWIDEAPVLVGGHAGIAPLPNLSVTTFDSATANGFHAGFMPSEEMELIGSNGRVVGSPSAPDPEADGFNDCTWSANCSAPASSAATSPVYIHTSWVTIGRS